MADEVLGRIRDAGTYRQMRVLEGAQGPRMAVDGREVLLFAGSNYLDLAQHEEVTEAAVRAAREHGCAAGGSRLISGNSAEHERLESELAEFFGRQAALVFNTGYMANLGLIPALVGPGDWVVSDALNHASIIDGARLSKAETRIFPHADLTALEQLLGRSQSPRRRVLVVLDGIYSMDGDLAPVAEASDLAERYGAWLLVDDAHGTGTLGARGRGSLEHAGVDEDRVQVLMGTLGKALGAFGAFVVGSRKLRELLINTARSFIFSCALAPPQVAAARAALSLLEREPWRRYRLQSNARLLRQRLRSHGLSTLPSASHIVPVVLGDNTTTMAVCEALLERGFYAQGIRYPSVAPGTARLRITPMASHSEEEILAVADSIAELVAKYPAESIPARAAVGS
ncbi:MAG: 8-amino-7-oxononanoate synthase [Myxococcota bacterium]